jgi:hypothetical protein
MEIINDHGRRVSERAGMYTERIYRGIAQLYALASGCLFQIVFVCTAHQRDSGNN